MLRCDRWSCCLEEVEIKKSNVSEQLVFKNSIFHTYFDRHVPCAIQCDVQQKSTDGVIHLYQKMKITCIEQTKHLLLSLCIQFAFVFTICVDLSIGDTHLTGMDFRKMIHPSG